MSHAKVHAAFPHVGGTGLPGCRALGSGVFTHRGGAELSLPVLLVRGDDRNVDFSQTVDLAQRLRTRNVQFEQLVYQDEVHDFLPHRHWLAVYRAPADFFDRRLKPGIRP